MKQQLGDKVEIDFVVKDQFKTLLESNPYISRVHCFKESLSEIIPELRDRNYAHVVDLHKNLRSALLKRKLGVASSSFPKLNRQKWMLVNFKRNKLPKVHIVERYFSAVEKLGVKNDEQGLDYFFPENQDDIEKILPSDFISGYTAVSIGAAHNTKRYPESRVIALCKKLPKVVLIGGSQDKEKADRISIAVGATMFNAVGKLSLHGSATVIKYADCVVSNDTGMMHIAAAFRKKIVSVWGNTVPEFGMYPYMPGDEDKSTIHQISDLACRPCSKIGYANCPKGHFKCMLEIDPAAVAASVLE